AESAAGLCQPVDPRLQLAWDRKVVQGSTHDHNVCGKELVNQLLSQFILALFGVRQWGTRGTSDNQRIGRKMRWSFHGQVQVFDVDIRVMCYPLVNDLLGEAARYRGGAIDAGINM